MPSNTFKFELSEGTYTVTLYSPDTGSVTNITLVIGDNSQQGDTMPDNQTDDKKEHLPSNESKMHDEAQNAQNATEKPTKYPDKPVYTFERGIC